MCENLTMILQNNKFNKVASSILWHVPDLLELAIDIETQAKETK
jgi:hypothetical protein